jgi:hypothetical protein
VFLQSLTCISPGPSLALVLPFVVVFAGGALPLVVKLRARVPDNDPAGAATTTT